LAQLVEVLLKKSVRSIVAARARKLGCIASGRIGDAGGWGHDGRLLFGVAQPEGHAHGAEEVARGRDRRRSLTVAPSLIQAAEAEVAVRLERSHAELLCEGEGLPVALLGPVEGRRLALHRDRREQPDDMRLVPALAVLLRSRACAAIVNALSGRPLLTCASASRAKRRD